MVSNRWRIGQEGFNGNNLVIRDMVSSLGGIDARYLFTAGAHTNV